MIFFSQMLQLSSALRCHNNREFNKGFFTWVNHNTGGHKRRIDLRVELVVNTTCVIMFCLLPLLDLCQRKSTRTGSSVQEEVFSWRQGVAWTYLPPHNLGDIQTLFWCIHLMGCKTFPACALNARQECMKDIVLAHLQHR